MTTLEDIKRIGQERGIEFYFAQFVDLYGRPSAKLVPGRDTWTDLVADGAGFAGFAAGEIGQVPSDPDIAAMPDLDSFTPVPWQPNLARFACDITVEGEEWPYCPRTILRARARPRQGSSGYEFKLGLELEYFLVRRRDDGSIEVVDRADTLEKPCYDMAGLTRHYDFLTTVSKYCNDLGWGNYANDHEDANGQFEQNFTYDDALVSCDRAIFFRYMVHTLAEQHGMVATFMPKPFTNLTGNGCHFHMSLWGRREPVPRRVRPARARAVRDGVQLRRRAEGARACLQRPDRADRQLVQAAEARDDVERGDLVAGLDLVRLQQPHADAPHPGARARSRTARSTDRANPYLAAAAVLAAGLDGIEHADRPGRAELGEPLRESVRRARATSGSQPAGEPARGDRRARAGRRPPRRRSGAGATRTTSTTTSASSATSGSATTSRSRRGSSAST